MMKIVKSLLAIVAVGAVAGGATWAYFSSTATVTGNTFSTGTLQVRVDGEQSKVGFVFEGALPGDCKGGTYTVQNYGAPWFGGPSTVTAKKLTMTINKASGTNDELFDALKIDVKKCTSDDDCQEVATNSALSSVNGSNILMSWYMAGGLIPGSSEQIRYEVCLPASDSDQGALQGKTAKFDFVFEGRSS
jgi:predicted ribosomally synthesized peptide with SipW-like signal peptide